MKTKYKLVENIINFQEKLSPSFLVTKFENCDTEEKFKYYLQSIKLEKYLIYLGYTIYMFAILINFLLQFLETNFNENCEISLKSQNKYNNTSNIYSLNRLISWSCAFVLDLILLICEKFLKNRKYQNFQKINLHFKVFLYLIFASYSIFWKIIECPSDKIILADYFMMTIVNNIGYIIFLDDSMVNSLLLAFFHQIILIFFLIQYQYESLNFSIKNIFVSFLFSVFSFLIKKNKEFIFRSLFIQKYKFRLFFNYCDTLMSELNCLHLCYVNKKLIFVNKNFSNFLYGSSGIYDKNNSFHNIDIGKNNVMNFRKVIQTPQNIELIDQFQLLHQPIEYQNKNQSDQVNSLNVENLRIKNNISIVQNFNNSNLNLLFNNNINKGFKSSAEENSHKNKNIFITPGLLHHS